MKDVERKGLAEGLMWELNARRDEYQRITGQQLPQYVFVSPQKRIEEFLLMCIAACLYVVGVSFALYMSAAMVPGVPAWFLVLLFVIAFAVGAPLFVRWIRQCIVSSRSEKGDVHMVGWSESDIRYLQNMLAVADNIITRHARGEAAAE